MLKNVGEWAGGVRGSGLGGLVGGCEPKIEIIVKMKKTNVGGVRSGQ